VAGIASLLPARRMLDRAPRGDGRPVMLLPGLVVSDLSNLVLRRYLNRLGYHAVGWGLGRNLGMRSIGADGAILLRRVEALQRESGAPVTLVGVSLGGIMARLVAHRRPDLVREVITVASPYAGHPHATRVWKAYETLTGGRIDDALNVALRAEVMRPLPVPATAIWSRSDGLVNGLICHAPGEPGLRAIEVRSGHMGVQMRPAVLRAVADVLGGVGTSPERSSG
jgi:triacylglycerol lipase